MGAVVRHDGRLLLVQRGAEPGRGQWSLPGGRVEFGETLADAVVREVAEEVGLDVECGGLLGWVERLSDSHHFVIADFTATLVGGSGLTPGSDADAARWVAPDELRDLDLVDGLAQFLTDHGVIDGP